jgi:hypothetical protein
MRRTLPTFRQSGALINETQTADLVGGVALSLVDDRGGSACAQINLG